MSNSRTADDWIELIETVVSVAIQVSIFSVAVSALMTGRWLTAFSGFAVLALSFGPAMLERKLRVRLPVELTLFVCIFLFASFVLGEVRDFYEQLWWWDLLLHGTSALLIGLIGFLSVYVFYVTNRIQVSP